MPRILPLSLLLFVSVIVVHGETPFLTLPFLTERPMTEGWVESKAWTPHRAIDYDAPIGTEVVAAAAGWAIASCQPQASIGDYAFGTFVLVQHDNGYSSLYAHLSAALLEGYAQLPCDNSNASDQSRFRITGTGPIGSIVRQRVAQAEPIGKVGTTGNAPRSHLHFEVALNADGSYVSHVAGKLDPYDIESIYSSYPPPNQRCNNVGSQARYLWTACAPVPPASSPAPLAALQISTGSNQSGPAGSILPNAVSVLALDGVGNPVGLVPVTFRVTSGGGCVSASPAGTNCQPELAMITNGTSGPLPGLAGGFWKLGPLSGTQTVEVVSPGLTTITFSADAR